YFLLLFASAGVLEHSGIKIPYFAFFAHDRGFETTEAPLNMRVAMGIAAFLCIAIGVFPAPLYNILPYAVDYHPYDASHVTGQMQLLIFAMLAFVVLIRMRLYPPEIPSVVLNSDWFYRRLAPQIGRPVLRAVMLVWGSFLCQMRGFIEAFWFVIDKLVRSPAAGPTIPGPAALVQLILLLAVLSIGYVAALG
ncbi:MAG: Na(+)/H(+) antiporter subunit D, partial [Candidatus Puniceispirillaceae bacterium]